MDKQYINLNDMKRDIYDEVISPSDREHAYYNYWMQLVASKDNLSHQEITELLSFSQWENPLGEIVAYLCRTKKIDDGDVASMKAKLPFESFAYKQLLAFEATNNRSHDWKTKYAIATELKANWAISQILKDVRPEEIEDARRVISSLDIGKNTKRWQLEILSNNR